MSDETTLLPCPICGKKVSIARTENEVGERWWFITRGTYKTTRCNCRLFLESEKFTCDWNDDYSLECRAKLVEKWNTRAELGSGTLTAEQVRDLIERHSMAVDYSGRKRVFHSCSCEAIADELNAHVGRTCEACAFSKPTDLTDGCAALERIAELEEECDQLRKAVAYWQRMYEEQIGVRR